MTYNPVSENAAMQYTLGYQDGFLEAKNLYDHGTGYWIVEDEEQHTYRCSACNELSCCRGNFCPDCGAKMKTEEKQ